MYDSVVINTSVEPTVSLFTSIAILGDECSVLGGSQQRDLLGDRDNVKATYDAKCPSAIYTMGRL